MKILAAIASMILATLFAVGCLRSGLGWLRGIVTAMTLTLVPGFAVLVPARRPPDLDHFGSSGRFHCRR